jgi:hypothetical protein
MHFHIFGTRGAMSVGKVWADVPKCSAKGYNQLVPIHHIKGHEMQLSSFIKGFKEY